MGDTVKYIDNASGSSKPLSRYFNTRVLLSIDNVAIQASWVRDLIEDADDDIYYQIPPDFEFRPDLISEDVYGTPWLYWVIGFKNGMTDAFAESYIGAKLRLPSYQRVVSQIIRYK